MADQQSGGGGVVCAAKGTASTRGELSVKGNGQHASHQSSSILLVDRALPDQNAVGDAIRSGPLDGP